MKIALALTLVMTIYAAMPPQTPIIGIFTIPDQGEEPKIGDPGPLPNRTYISASYVKFVQMSGAQVVPIFAFNDTKYLDDMLSKVNGVLFTGGGFEIDINDLRLRWTANADHILKYAIESNKRGNPFPVWGTCLGLELLAFLTSGYDPKVVSEISGQQRVNNTINILEKSYLYDGIPENIRDGLQNGDGIVYFNHQFALHTSYFRSSSYLKNFWVMTSTTTSSSGQEFVSTMEAKSYPFFAVQFHPEKNLFEWKVQAVRSNQGAQIVQILSNKFIEIARQNKNRFSSYEQFKKLSIYNYDAHPTTMSFLMVYTFDEIVVFKTDEQNSKEKQLTIQ